MVKAWILVKIPLVDSKVSGVFGNHQKAIEHLTRYNTEDISINLKRENSNEFDRNAIAVMVSVKGSPEYCVGYVPKEMAAIIAPIMDAHKAVRGIFREVRGKYTDYMNYGLKIALAI